MGSDAGSAPEQLCLFAKPLSVSGPPPVKWEPERRSSTSDLPGHCASLRLGFFACDMQVGTLSVHSVSTTDLKVCEL